MLIALGVVLPVIAVIVIGFGVARLGLFSEDNVATLNRFVFTLAAPALLFRNVALTEFPENLSLGIWVSYYAPMLLIMGVTALLARSLFVGRAASEYVIIGFGGCFSNTVMLGIPIILTAFGPAAGLPLFLILAFHGLLVFTTALICLEATTNPNLKLKDIPPKLAMAMRDQAVVIALIAGVIWNFTGLSLAAPIDNFLDLLGSAAIPVALVAIGGRLAYIKIGDNVLPSLYVGVFKLGLMPLAVYLTAQHVFGLEPLFVASITVLSAMPTGVFTAVFAAHYQTAEAEAASTIVVTSIMSTVTISLWLSLFNSLLVS